MALPCTGPALLGVARPSPDLCTLPSYLWVLPKSHFIIILNNETGQKHCKEQNGDWAVDCNLPYYGKISVDLTPPPLICFLATFWYLESKDLSKKTFLLLESLYNSLSKINFSHQSGRESVNRSTRIKRDHKKLELRQLKNNTLSCHSSQTGSGCYVWLVCEGKLWEATLEKQTRICTGDVRSLIIAVDRVDATMSGHNGRGTMERNAVPLPRCSRRPEAALVVERSSGPLIWIPPPPPLIRESYVHLLHNLENDHDPDTGTRVFHLACYVSV
ncbi:hypothetical protein J6590_010030 [Homalodisca vitripennis]|nr:hypothetical protein J6590_010030 [Homalodisca vitripennis]